jgi:hypothetical protein
LAMKCREPGFGCFHKLVMRLFAFIVLLFEFTGSYRQTKSGDEKYHRRDEKLRLTSGPQLGRRPVLGCCGRTARRAVARRLCSTGPWPEKLLQAGARLNTQDCIVSLVLFFVVPVRVSV